MVAPRSRSILPFRNDKRDKEMNAPGEAGKAVSGIPAQDYADRVKLAQHLHDQGINPLTWTQAQPASFAEQEEFRKTGQKPRENQFEVSGRLYDATPALAATPAQAKVALDRYLRDIGDRTTESAPPIEQFVEIDKVPLRHPLGQAVAISDTRDNRLILRNMIKTGVNPKNAHLGDPVPWVMQEKLKQSFQRQLLNSNDAVSTRTPDEADEPEPGDLIYRNADGWIYAKNEATREPDAVSHIRMRHAEKRGADTANPVNDNDEVEEIAQYYTADPGLPQQTGELAEQPEDNEQLYNEQAAERLATIAQKMPVILSAVEKTKAGQDLSKDEQEAIGELQASFARIGLKIDPTLADLNQLHQVATAIVNTHKAIESKLTQGETVNAETRIGRAPLHVATQGLNNELAQALVGSTVAWAQVAQNGPAQALLSGLMASKNPANMPALPHCWAAAPRAVSVPLRLRRNGRRTREAQIFFRRILKEAANQRSIAMRLMLRSKPPLQIQSTPKSRLTHLKNFVLKAQYQLVLGT